MAKKMRRCLGCRVSSEKELLLRFVVSRDSELILDKFHDHGGRGAYLHDKLECRLRALKVEVWKRALRVQNLDVQGLKSLMLGDIT